MKDLSDQILDMRKGKACDLLDEAEVQWRIVSVDGDSLPRTFDLREGRHNLYVENGRISKVTVESL
jgi:hypothetical protein